jgi:hypothetical protein
VRPEAQKTVPDSLSIKNVVFSVSWGGVRVSPLGTSATVWLIVPAQMMDDDVKQSVE